jgi:hypothetical protein
VFGPTGINMQSHFGAITTDADAVTVTFQIDQSIRHLLQLGGNRTLAVSGDKDGQIFYIILQQPPSGTGCTAKWWSGVSWPYKTAPILSTGPNVRDTFSFFRLSTTAVTGPTGFTGPSYLGYTVALNQ